MTIRFDGKVAIVTGAGQGLGRAHVLALAARGAKVVVDDLGGAIDGTGGSATAAETVVAQITAAGGEAMANAANVTHYDEVEAMVGEAIARWGRVDILVNNAGILRDKSLSKLDLADFRTVLEVHLHGALHCTKACWEPMRAQNFGRIVVTTSSAGLYGNFGQAAYGSAKAALLGLMHTLAKEGAKNNVRINALSPAAATRMTESLLTPQQTALLTPESVAAGVCFLASDEAPTDTILTAGAGSYAVARLFETVGKWLPETEQTPEGIAANWSAISDPAGQLELGSVEAQTGKFLEQAMVGLGLKTEGA